MYYPNISDPEYFAIEALSNSKLSEFEREQTGRQAPNPENYRIGSLVDSIITTPDQVTAMFLTAHGVEYTEQEFGLAFRMVDEFKKTVYWPMVESSIKQAVHVSQISLESGSMVMKVTGKAKLDFWADKARSGGDIKTTVATTQEQFEKMIEFLNYDRQSSWYCDVADIDRFLLLGISKVARKIFPYMIRRGDSTYERGKSKYVDLAWRYQLMYGDISQLYLTK